MGNDAVALAIERLKQPVRVLNESTVRIAGQALRLIFGPIFSGCKPISYEAAVDKLNLEKSPGYPWYFYCNTTEEALYQFGDVIKDEVLRIIAGEDLPAVHTGSLKDELRTADRVAAHKTRIFMSSGKVQLIVGKMLFYEQEEAMRDLRGSHPVTIGLGVPGPDFTTTLLSLTDQVDAWSGDIGKQDLGFILRLAREIRDIRCEALPEEFRPAAYWYYDNTYAGLVALLGCLYRWLCNKSGHELTGDDNSLEVTLKCLCYIIETTDCNALEAVAMLRLLVNGDDVMVAFQAPLSGPGWRKWLQENCGQDLELEYEEPRHPRHLSYLSHHLRLRHIYLISKDVLIAAGNQQKLISSLEWFRKSDTMSNDLAYLCHLIGLRINLWPWLHLFEELELRIDQHLARIVKTPEVLAALRARIAESQILNLHLRFESAPMFFEGLLQDGVCTEIISAILKSAQMGHSNKSNEKEMARRLAQSRRDKAAHTYKQGRGPFTRRPAGSPAGMNSGKAPLQRVLAPAAQGFRSASRFAVNRSSRFKDGIVVEGWDHLEFVVTPASPAPVAGQVLNEIYINPSEFGGTRLEKYAALYEKYLFEKLDFEYVPGVGSDQTGTIGLAYDRDISDPTPPATEQGLRQFTSFEGAVDNNVWLSQCCKNKLQQPDSGYYTNPVVAGDDRLSYQGQFYVFVVTPPPVNKVLGRLKLHFKLHLFVPQLENSVMVGNNSDSPGVALPGTAQVNADLLKKIFNNLSTEGIQQWKIQLDSLGKAYIPLAQGVYRYLTQQNRQGTIATVVAGGIAEANAPTLVPNDPQPATAPQPWQATASDLAASYATGDEYSGLSQSGFVGVPRGGAKMYVTYNAPSTTGGDDYLTQIEIERLSGYVPSAAALFSLSARRWSAEEALRKKRRAVRETLVPDIEDCHDVACDGHDAGGLVSCLDKKLRVEEPPQIPSAAVFAQEVATREARANLKRAATNFARARVETEELERSAQLDYHDREDRDERAMGRQRALHDNDDRSVAARKEVTAIRKVTMPAV